ncbi:Pex4 [Kluyveromyces lactis]|nr:Pex4 [Kluyveromyces lactis]
MSRIVKEYMGLQKRLQTPEFSWITSLAPVDDDDLSEWVCQFQGPLRSPFEGFELGLNITIDLEKYPISGGPRVQFEPRTVAHPNVKWDTGEICLDLLKDAWTPIYTLIDVVGAIRDLLADPGLDSPLDLDIAQIYDADYEAYVQIVRYRLEEARLARV